MEGVDLKAGRRTLNIRSHRGLELVPVADIRCFSASQKYITVYHTHGTSMLDSSLKRLLNEFSGNFVRVHRNALVSFRHIVGLRTVGIGRVTVQIQHVAFQPNVSRRRVGYLRNLLSDR